MFRARYEGFVSPPPAAAAPPMTVDQHIIISITDLTDKITKLQNDLENAIIDISGVRASVCAMNQGIQADYVLAKTPPASQAELTATPDRQKLYASNRTSTGVQAWTLAQTSYIFLNRVQLLDCTPPPVVDISGTKATDISGANQTTDVSGAAPPTDISGSKPAVEGFFAPPDPTQVADLLAKLQQAQDMFTTYSQTPEVATWFDTISKIPNTEAFLSSLMEIAEKNYEGFQDANDTDISGAYANPLYTYPVPFKSTQINNTQAATYRTISAAYDVYKSFIDKVGKQYQEAKYQAGVLAIKYNKYQAAKNKNSKKPLSFEQS